MHESANLAPQVDDLFARARAGDDAAWYELFHACYPKIIRVVRRKLNRPLRNIYDSADFASDVMKSLAAKADHLDFPSLRSLLTFLTEVAEKKVIDEHRKLHTQKRDVDRERRLEGESTRDGRPAIELPSGEPTASQVAQEGEIREQLLAGQDAEERRVIELKRLGHSNAEISELTGWNIRKVQRFIKCLQDSMGNP